MHYTSMGPGGPGRVYERVLGGRALGGPGCTGLFEGLIWDEVLNVYGALYELVDSRSALAEQLNSFCE